MWWGRYVVVTLMLLPTLHSITTPSLSLLLPVDNLNHTLASALILFQARNVNLCVNCPATESVAVLCPYAKRCHVLHTSDLSEDTVLHSDRTDEIVIRNFVLIPHLGE